jgi:type III secretion protein D
METTPNQPESTTPLELRVLEGPQAGARAPLPEGLGCEIAAAAAGDGADVWLRDETAAPVRVRVIAALPHGAIEVLEGQVQLGDEWLDAGVQAAWAMHQPLTLGRFVVAFGVAHETEWPDAAGAQSAHGATTTPHKPRRRAELWLTALGAGIAIASAGALMLAHVAAAPRTETSVAPTLDVALRTSEFAMLETAREPDGHVRLSGRLATLAQRARLDAWLAARDFAPKLDVQVDENLARDVTDVFRVNGVAVQARVTGPGLVVAEAAERDPERLARAVEVVRRDVHGLDKLAVENRAKPLPPPAPALPDDPGKRIASLVPGDPGYLVTADGSRYFIGAVLPSGHRVTAIAQQRVTLERDGQSQTLNF